MDTNHPLQGRPCSPTHQGVLLADGLQLLSPIGMALGARTCLLQGPTPSQGVLFFFFPFWPYYLACGILVPQAGIEPMPPQWKHGALTTGPPGKSHPGCAFKSGCCYLSGMVRQTDQEMIAIEKTACYTHRFEEEGLTTPHRATWGSTRVGQSRRKHGQEPLLWFPQEGTWVR